MPVNAVNTCKSTAYSPNLVVLAEAQAAIDELGHFGKDVTARELSYQITLVESVKFADKLAKAKPLATMLVARRGPSLDTESDKVITKWVNGNIQTLHHLIETAATVPKLLGGVVDEMPKL
ncbi:hypothetical protein RhiTH_001116 [Rhizoctonia solani]